MDPTLRIRRFEVPFLRMRNTRQSGAASHSASVFEHEEYICGHGGHAHRRYIRGPGGGYRAVEVPFGEMRSARQSTAASRSAHVSKHHTRITPDGERVTSGDLRGAGVSSSV